MMLWTTDLPIAIGPIVGVVLLGAAMILGLKLKLGRDLRRKGHRELEQSVFRYEQDYFGYIGHDHPDVATFKSLVETRDLQGIRARWKDLSRSFVQLETKAGHRGRPLLLDYYFAYELDIAELTRRGP